MSPKPKPKQSPSETYAARVARGRVPLSLSVSADAAASLTELAARANDTKSAVVERLILEAADRTDSVPTHPNQPRRRPKTRAVKP